MKTVTFQTEGMHCQSCETLVTESLTDLEGVNDAEASYKDGKVTVSYDESKTKEEALRSAVESEGYRVI